MYELAKPLFPLACEAFEDYNVGSVKVSKSEVSLLKRLISDEKWIDLLEDFRDEAGIIKQFDLSNRELAEFKDKWL
jgi:hypothetical protein